MTMTPNECECGGPKSARASACKRCLYLDGERRIAGEVIAALRGTDGLSLREICEQVRGEQSHSARTAMLRVVQVLMRKQRVCRYWREMDSHEITTERSGIAARLKRGGNGCWVYILDGLTERQYARRAA